MTRDDIVLVCCSDIAGQVRGKGFLARELNARRRRGVGWTPTNILITCHGEIAPGPWGAFGDLMLVPDEATHVRVDFGDGEAPEQFVLGDIRHLDASPWECCPRDFLRRGLAALQDEFGLRLRAAFEHEFHLDFVEERANSSYALDAVRRQGSFAGVLMSALLHAGITPDTFMAEYGPSQYEVTVGPASGLRAADQAVILRELTRASARRCGGRASFTPILRPDAVGNGVHVHFSLWDAAGEQPVSFDADAPEQIASAAGAFLAGIARRLPALVALSAASPISYLRLTPNRWSAAYNNLGRQDREAALRICPVFAAAGPDPAQQFHFEYRAADAAASPYLLLGGLVWAGLDGLRAGLDTPPVTTGDPSRMAPAELAALGLARLPQTLESALDALAADDDFKAWLGPTLHDAYLRHKRFEAELMAPLSPEERCARYHLVY